MVFATEQELRKHRMEQHRGEMVEGLSRAERRAALTIPINVNVRCASKSVLGAVPVRLLACPNTLVMIGITHQS